MLGWEEGSLSDIDIGGLGGLVALVWCVRSQDNSSGGGALVWDAELKVGLGLLFFSTNYLT